MALILVICSLISIFALSASAGGIYNWYCVHRKDHLQPSADPDIVFIEEFSGFYIDRAHGDDCDDKVIYLTFDAGYENGNVAKTLDILKEEQVCGAFFILGNLIDKNTDLVKRMFEEGHLVCNHTFSHRSMINRTKAEFEDELNKIEKFCFERTGYSMSKYYRPPEGKFDRASMQYAHELGYKTVFWSFAYADWDNSSQMSAEKAKSKILSNIHNGEIMLLHPTSATNAQILGDVIRELKAQGFRFGSLDELGTKR
jgi:peptidoglycan-N-acetylmuramic acid deacetylase